MNILGQNSAKLNEVIFKNKNKNYGAYAIRSSYNESIVKSLVTVIGSTCLLFGSVIAYNKYTADKSIIESGFVIDDSDYEVIEYTNPLVNEPKVESVKPIVEETAAAKGGVATIINDHVIDTDVTNTDNPNSGQGDETSKGTSLTSTTSSTVETQPEIIKVEAEKKEVETVFIASDMPEFEGGVEGLMRFVSQNIVYPEIAKQMGHEGTVYVSFIVSETGSVQDAKVMKGIGYGCDEEVLRVVNKIPKWKKAGKNTGHPVKVRFNIPVKFKLK